MDERDRYRQLAKDAGNRLRAYILSVSSGATGVFFFSIVSNDGNDAGGGVQWLLLIALFGFVSTVGICLFELRVDARRFFALAKEMEKPEDEQSWAENERFKRTRYFLINLSYVAFPLAMLATSTYLFLKVTSPLP